MNKLEDTQFIPSEQKYTLKRNIPDDEFLSMAYKERPPVGLDYKDKNAIIIFGCSFGHGSYLEENQTLHYKLSQMLHRPAYNFASPGQAPQFALMKIRSKKIDDIIKNTDYVIYVTIGEHIWRVHTNSNGYPQEYLFPKYDNKNGKLVYHKYKIPEIEGSYLYKYIEKTIFAKLMTPSHHNFIQNYLFDFIKLHFEAIKDEVQAINPNAKMIILVYHDRNETEQYVYSKRWKELEAEGITVVNLYEELPQLMYEGDKYQIPNDGHPNEAAWDIITDLIVNKLKIID